MDNPKTFTIATLGCRTNQYESQAYRDQLLALGLREAGKGEKADLCIVNTCTVTEEADKSSRRQIRGLAKAHPESNLIVTGCLAERQPDLLRSIEGVTRVVPNLEKEGIVETLFSEREVPEFSIKNFEAHTRAFVKVQDGCNSFCTYCIIPYVRGRSRSRSIDSVVAEVKGLVAGGFKEVVITGINVGDFDGGGSGKTLADLIRAVDAVDGLKRLRLSSIDPDEVGEPLLEAILEGKNTCRSMHIVLQAGSNVVLRRMNRKYTRQVFLETYERIRAADSDFTLTTDLIVGFPGETEADFEETLEVMRTVRFAKVHMFPFSRRERTRAALYDGILSPEEMTSRKRRLLTLEEQCAFELRNEYVGRKMTVLIEDGKGGHTDNFLWVDIEGHPNELVEVEIVSNGPAGLIGR